MTTKSRPVKYMPQHPWLDSIFFNRLLQALERAFSQNTEILPEYDKIAITDLNFPYHWLRETDRAISLVVDVMCARESEIFFVEVTENGDFLVRSIGPRTNPYRNRSKLKPIHTHMKNEEFPDNIDWSARNHPWNHYLTKEPLNG